MHRLLGFLGSSPDHKFRLLFRNHDFVVVTQLYPLDKSIYGLDGGWSGEVVDNSGMPTEKQRLFRVGSGLDFYEEDLSSVFDETTGETLALQN